MRSPAATFDLRGALSEEINAALAEIEAPVVKPKAAHRCRVHIKRARALARVGRACAPGLSKVFNESARDVMHALSRQRDLVALATCARDIARRSRGKDRRALLAAADALDQEREIAAEPDLEAIRAGVRDLLAMAHVWPEASVRQIRRGAARIVRRARQAHRRGYGASAPTRRHEWRKREKDRLYASQILQAEWPERHKRRRKRSEQLANMLGDERDAILLRERLSGCACGLGSENATERALATVSRWCRRLARRADRLGRKLHAGGA